MQQRPLDGRPLGIKVAQQVCTRIKAIEMSPRKVPGTTIGNASTGEVIYTPPSGNDLLLDLLSNWERFLHAQDDLDPLVRMAVAHYQFEAIHPFTDGNGRTGRILNSLFLVDQGLLGAPVLYLSRYIIRNKEAYYRLLLGVTKGADWEPWLLYMLGAVTETSAWTLNKIQAIRELIKETKAHVQQSLPKIYSSELVEQIFELPYCRIAHLVSAGIAQRQAASRYLGRLADINVLEERQDGRGKVFVNTRFLALLSTEANEYEPLS
ncbi:MAG: Fic family protein [Planctomycetota bacterium]